MLKQNRKENKRIAKTIMSKIWQVKKKKMLEYLKIWGKDFITIGAED